MAQHIQPIQPKELTQIFGVNPAAYKRFGLNGHNGWDYRTKFPDTLDGHRTILAPFATTFYKQGNEGNDGYGVYLETLVQAKRLWKLTFAHCHHTDSFVGTKKLGTPLALSDNTGNSTGSHLHLTTKPGNLVNGVFVSENSNNGFKGAVDPQLFFNELAQLPEGEPVMQPDFKAAYLTLAKEVYGDDYNENWNADEKKMFLIKIKQKSIDYKFQAEHPPVQTDTQLHDKVVAFTKALGELQNI